MIWFKNKPQFVRYLFPESKCKMVKYVWVYIGRNERIEWVERTQRINECFNPLNENCEN